MFWGMPLQILSSAGTAGTSHLSASTSPILSFVTGLRTHSRSWALLTIHTFSCDWTQSRNSCSISRIAIGSSTPGYPTARCCRREEASSQRGAR